MPVSRRSSNHFLGFSRPCPLLRTGFHPRSPGPNRESRYLLLVEGWLLGTLGPLVGILTLYRRNADSIDTWSIFIVFSAMSTILIVLGVVSYFKKLRVGLILIASTFICIVLVCLDVLRVLNVASFFGLAVQVISLIFLVFIAAFRHKYLLAHTGPSYYWMLGISVTGILHTLGFLFFYRNQALAFTGTSFVGVLTILYVLHLEHDISLYRLRASERYRTTLFERSPIGLILTTMNGDLREANAAFLSIIGRDPAESLALNFREILADKDKYLLADVPQELKLSGKYGPHEAEFQNKDGQLIPVRIQGLIIRNDDKELLWSTVEDISDIKTAEKELEANRRNLEEIVVERTKDLESFSYSVSHDLRAPLRAIDGFTAILMSEYGPSLDLEGRRLVSIVRANTLKMSRLIDDILSFARIGRTTPNFTRIDMQSLVETVFEEASSSMEKSRIDFRVDQLDETYGDLALLRIVWTNLVSNALKYTSRREKAVISVSFTKDEGGTTYCIEDNGVGFDMRYKDKLFTVFQRLHDELEFEGTGIGLAMVRRIVEKHGGRIWAESEVDKGARFCFFLTGMAGTEGET